MIISANQNQGAPAAPKGNCCRYWQGMLEPIRKAAGCRAATLYQDVDNENVVSLQADWETQGRNGATCPLGKIFSVLRGAIRTLSRHEAAEGARAFLDGRDGGNHGIKNGVRSEPECHSGENFSGVCAESASRLGDGCGIESILGTGEVLRSRRMRVYSRVDPGGAPREPEPAGLIQEWVISVSDGPAHGRRGGIGSTTSFAGLRQSQGPAGTSGEGSGRDNLDA